MHGRTLPLIVLLVSAGMLTVQGRQAGTLTAEAVARQVQDRNTGRDSRGACASARCRF
jgi:hypothetical protein